MHLFRFVFSALLLLTVPAASSLSAQVVTYQELTGFDLLPANLNGSGIVFGLVEADTSADTTITNYRSNWAGVTFTYEDAAAVGQTYGASGHANTVMARYALAATGVTDVVNTETLSFYNRYLGINSTGYPTATVAEPVADVINLSFIFNSLDTNTWTAIENRTDYLASKWNKVVVAGVSTSGGAIAAPGSAYNVISVAELNNTYTAPNRTNLDTTGGPTPGRLKPELLAPGSTTNTSTGTAPSFAAPVVSAAAAVLLQAARETPALAAADDARVVKSLLLTGATKLAGWSADPTSQPLDFDQGAGVVNVANSYAILAAGQAPASTSTVHGLSGWDLKTVTLGNGPNSPAEAWYFIDVPSTGEDFAGFTLTATLAWNRQIADNFTATLRNLDLQLFAVTAGTFTPTTSLALSNSTLDNVEHIYTSFGAGMAGRYAIKVSGVGFASREAETFALSWDIETLITPIPEPAHIGAYVALIAGGFAVVIRRRRWRLKRT